MMLNDIGLFNAGRLVHEGQLVDDENNSGFPGCLIIDTGWNEWAFHVTDKVLYEIVDGELVKSPPPWKERDDWSVRWL